MKTVTAEKVGQKARWNLAGVVVLIAILLWLPTQDHYDTSDWWLTGGLVVLVLVTDGYRSLRLLLDKAYLKRYLIRRNDERTMHVENLAFRKLVQIVGYAYTVLAGVLLGFLVPVLPNQELCYVALALLGFGLFGVAVYYISRCYYDRRF